MKESSLPPTSSSTCTSYKKRLLGVQSTPVLRNLLEVSWSSVANSSPSATTGDTEKSKSALQENCTNFCVALSKEESQSILAGFQDQRQAKVTTDEIFPIAVIRAMDAILNRTNKKELEEALSSTQLVFSKTPQPMKSDEDNAEKQRWRKRMQRLRYKEQEARYKTLTENVGSSWVKDDDVTTKSMTYAASIGLNMIIAPISFSCFMYFFGGGLLDYIWPANHDDPAAVDMKKIIIGVISGVLMLFIEMTLFVIRTHELDKAVRQKERKSKQRKTAFGHYTSETSKTFSGK